MLEQIKKLYSSAILSDSRNLDRTYIWLKDPQSGYFIGIPKHDLPPDERRILETLFPMDEIKKEPPMAEEARTWHTFLHKDGPAPSDSPVTCRLIHYKMTELKEEFLFEEWEEAIKSLFPYSIIHVPETWQEGVIIERENDPNVAEEELVSAIQAFESDFFFKIHFYVGQFRDTATALKDLFPLEKSLFHFSLLHNQKERLITLEKVMPLYLNHIIPPLERNTLFANIQSLLNDDRELAAAIKRYIENHSNATLTAKELFLHRNSLQYRIDKFISKTGIDIKSFHGALTAYLACLHNENG
ncbi:MAG TPA: helix-turn-helix domain-containing protein [Bacillaceae bacterium]